MKSFEKRYCINWLFVEQWILRSNSLRSRMMDEYVTSYDYAKKKNKAFRVMKFSKHICIEIKNDFTLS